MSRLVRLSAYYLERLGLSSYRRQLVFYIRRPGPPQQPFLSPPGFEFRFVQPWELEELHYPGGWLQLHEARQWLERGDSDLLAAIQRGRICSYLWVERRIARIDYLALEAPLPRGHAYISKVFVAPAWRRLGLARSMYQFLLAREPDHAYHSACVTENTPMRLLFSQLGWRPRLLLTTWKLTFLKRYSLEFLPQSRVRRFLHLQHAARSFSPETDSRTPGKPAMSSLRQYNQRRVSPPNPLLRPAGMSARLSSQTAAAVLPVSFPRDVHAAG